MPEERDWISMELTSRDCVATQRHPFSDCQFSLLCFPMPCLLETTRFFYPTPTNCSLKSSHISQACRGHCGKKKFQSGDSKRYGCLSKLLSRPLTTQKRLDTWWCRRQVSHCGSKKSDNRLIPQSLANPTLGREFASGRH